MVNTLEGKVAIVTGGSEGIGFGIALALAEKGSKVYLVARTPEKLEKARQRINDAGGKAEVRPADITNSEAMQGIIDEVYEENNGFDIFINNAGTYRPVSLDSDFDEVRKMLDLDMIAPTSNTHKLIQKFKLSDRNLKILNVISQAGIRVFPGGIGYGTAKIALAGALLNYRRELGMQNISNIDIYNIYPGTVATDNMLPLIRLGKLQNPTSIDSVINTALDLIEDKTPTKDIYVGYNPDRGIIRKHLESDPQKFNLLDEVKEEVLDTTFDPSRL
jgi:NAD(P)-dependent dehydrogenase (short-subunit alcohol dehydrogenase family)